jgi:hypothetical protein
MILSAGWYLIHGRKHYKGPPNVAVTEVETEKTGNASNSEEPEIKDTV